MKWEYKDKKFHLETTLNADDVCVKGTLTLKKMMLYLQKIAIEHYTQRAQSFEELMLEKKAWVLTRIEMNITKLPKLGQKIHVETWSKDVRGFKGFREYRILVGDETYVNVNSEWVYLDLVNKTPVIFNAEKFNDFERCDESHLEPIERWRLNSEELVDEFAQYQLRHTDFDLNYHLNNTIYFSLLEHYLVTSKKKYSNIKAAFRREVPYGVQELRAFRDAKGENAFGLFNADEVCFLCTYE